MNKQTTNRRRGGISAIPWPSSMDIHSHPWILPKLHSKLVQKNGVVIKKSLDEQVFLQSVYSHHTNLLIL